MARLPQVAASEVKERQRPTSGRSDWPQKLKAHRFRSVSINWLLPNMLTIAGLISGLTGLRFALDDHG